MRRVNRDIYFRKNLNAKQKHQMCSQSCARLPCGGRHYWHYQKIQYLRIEKVNLIPSDNCDYEPILCVLQIMFYAMYHITRHSVAGVRLCTCGRLIFGLMNMLVKRNPIC